MTATQNIEAWLSLVERYIRDVEVAGSNPVASIFFELSLLLKNNFLEIIKKLLTGYLSCVNIYKLLNDSNAKYRGVAQLGRALH